MYVNLYTIHLYMLQKIVYTYTPVAIIIAAHTARLQCFAASTCHTNTRNRHITRPSYTSAAGATDTELLCGCVYRGNYRPECARESPIIL